MVKVAAGWWPNGCFVQTLSYLLGPCLPITKNLKLATFTFTHLSHSRVPISHFKSFQEGGTVHRWCELNVSHQTSICFHTDCTETCKLCSMWPGMKWKGDLGKFVSVRTLGIQAPVVSALIARQRFNLRTPENPPECGFSLNCPLTPISDIICLVGENLVSWSQIWCYKACNTQ